MKVGFYDHRGLGQPYAQALTAAGHTISGQGDVLLIDNDAPLPPHDALFAAHDRAFLYPHGAGPSSSSDGHFPLHPKTRGRFVIGAGQVEVLAAAGDPLPVEAVGWPWCDQMPFRPVEPRRILFAPVHTDGYGHLDPVFRKLNAEIQDLLVGLGYELTVRTVIGDLAAHGLTAHPDVHYQPGEPRIEPAVIDAVDLVVTSGGTFHSVAIARGVPTVIYGQSVTEESIDPRNGQAIRSKQRAAVLDVGRYPYDLLDTSDPAGLLEQAATVEAADWRARFIGDPFDPARFVTLFEKAVEQW